MTVPALLSSIVLSGVCVFLYRLVLRVDRMQEAAAGGRDPGAAGPWQIGAGG